MDPSWIVFRGFFQKCSQEKKEEMLSCLPPDIQTFLLNAPETLKDVTKGIDSTDILDEIHYSWLAPQIRMHTEDEARLFLSALNQTQVKGLKKVLLFSNNLYPLSTLAKKFLRTQLLQNLTESDEILPLECLPVDPLNDLLNLSFAELKTLASFLGLRDFSLEMRLIIDNLKIKQITSVLTRDEQLYLKTITQQKEPLAFKKMGLSNWNGKSDTLRILLIQRGLNRLAKALHGHSKSLLWHIEHKFDTELGKTLTALCTPVDSEKGAQILVQQVLDLIPYIQNLETSI